MELLFVGCTALLGAIIGSFLNVVVIRSGTGMTLAGRSRCFSCGRQLFWFELVPVLSYVLLGGRCRTCRSHISIQYPLVELGTALAFGLVASAQYQYLFVASSMAIPLDTLALFGLLLFFWSVLIAIAAYDLRHMIIPDTLAVLLLCSAIATLLITHFSGGALDTHGFILDSATGLALGGIFLGIYLATRGKGMGLGDAKLAVPLGLAAGFPAGIDVLLFAFWIGTVVMLLLMGISRVLVLAPSFLRGARTLTMKSEIPFAPFLIAAFALVSFTNLSVTQFFMLPLW